jgi:hypothetical protein
MPVISPELEEYYVKKSKPWMERPYDFADMWNLKKY